MGNNGEQVFSEAPASFNVRAFSPGGFSVQLTLRSADGAELMPRALRAIAWLTEQDFTPNGAPAGDSGNSNGTAPVCQYHGAMKRSKKFSGWYCPSKMGDGTYCKEKVMD